jgi:hypothetical protein
VIPSLHANRISSPSKSSQTAASFAPMVSASLLS